MQQLESVSLYFTSGSSDKVYQAQIEESGDGYVVNFAYGRRGSTLTTGTKTKTPVDHATALQIFEKLVGEKQSKGYTPGDDGTPYQHSDKAGRVSGLLPQLLNVIDSNREAARIIDDPQWVMQEKFDGRRLMLRKTGPEVEGINKLGLTITVATPIAAAAGALSGDFVIDGEVIDDTFHVFDLLFLDGIDLREKPYSIRFGALTDLVDRAGEPAERIRYVECWTGTADKADQLKAFQARNAEGVVFKRWDAPYRKGRPNSGGTQLKYKFVTTLSAVVTKLNEQRSVAVSLHDGTTWHDVGNVSIPPNRDVPKLGDIIEVRYLYAGNGGRLYQPFFLGVRDDIEAIECVMSQLKFKAV